MEESFVRYFGMGGKEAEAMRGRAQPRVPNMVEEAKEKEIR